MTVRIPGRRAAPDRGLDDPTDPVAARLHALDHVVALGDGRLDPRRGPLQRRRVRRVRRVRGQ